MGLNLTEWARSDPTGVSGVSDVSGVCDVSGCSGGEKNEAFGPEIRPSEADTCALAPLHPCALEPLHPGGLHGTGFDSFEVRHFKKNLRRILFRADSMNLFHSQSTIANA